MRVLHVPYGYFPDRVGGTEIYVKGLVRALEKSGVHSIVCAPGPKSVAYEHAGTRVRRFAVGDLRKDLASFYGEGDPDAARGFERILVEEQPKIVHLHAVSPAVSVRVAREVIRHGIPLVLTYHTPTVTCQRGTLLLYGTSVCDGSMQVRRCTVCSLHGKGLPRPVAEALGWSPAALGRAIEEMGLVGSAWTAVRMSDLVARRQSAIKELLRLASRIVAPSIWVVDLLLRNGVAHGKIVLCRQGVDFGQPAGGRKLAEFSGKVQFLRTAFFGRLHAEKGLDVVVAALARIPNAPVTLDAYCIAQQEEQEPYARQLDARIRRDARIRIVPPIPGEGIVDAMRQYDLVLVPSQWLETGPLVVLEAFAAGIPVLGSNLGGIAERVRDGIDGRLVPAGDVAAWAEALHEMSLDRGVLQQMNAAIRPPPRMSDVAAQMHDLYREVASS